MKNLEMVLPETADPVQSCKVRNGTHGMWARDSFRNMNARQ